MNAWIMKPLPFTPLYGSETVAGYSIDAITNDYAGVVWKGAGDVGLAIDLGSPKAVDALLMFGCTGAKAAWSIVLQSADDDAFTVNLTTHAQMEPFLAGEVPPSHGRGVSLWQGQMPTIARYWRLGIYDRAGAEVTIARLCIGRRIELERNFAFGAGFGVRDLGNVDFSPAGVRVRRRAAKLRTVGLTFPAVRKDEVQAKVQPLVEQVAGQEPIVLVTDPAPDEFRQQRCYFGHLFGDLGTVWRSPAGFEWRANLIDLIPIPAGDIATVSLGSFTFTPTALTADAAIGTVAGQFSAVAPS